MVVWAWGLMAPVLGGGGEESLRSALHAVQKRQRDLALTPLPEQIFYSRAPANLIYGDGQPEDIGYGYQKSVPVAPGGVFEPVAIPYSELGASYDPGTALALERLAYDLEKEDMSSAKRSVFRERGDGGNNHLSDQDQPDDEPFFIASPFRERVAAGKSRLQGAHSLVRNYAGLSRNPEQDMSEDEYVNVLNSIWEKYKGEEDPEEITEADVEELLEYLANKEDKKRQRDFFYEPTAWAKRSMRNENHHKRYPETLFDERYPYTGGHKRFPISKRSPAPMTTNLVSHRHKKNTVDKQTDPKVAAELSNIFSEKKTKNVSHTTTTKPNITQSGQKEQPLDGNSLKPLDVKKKSVNWSDYFGIDRRKKSIDNQVNNDWLLKKYLEAYGMNGEPRVDDVDNKMKAMEDLMVDQAIKYTGSHEGTTDRNEVREVKDQVMAQLAAAYSLEKMRRALNEFKASLAAQKLSPAQPGPAHSSPLQAQAEPEYKAKRILKEKAELQGQGRMEKKESFEQTNEIDFGTLGEKDCPVLRGVERRCKKITNLAGDVNEVFLPLCNLHQMCYLCGPVLRAASPRECDSAFAEESESLCRDDPSCYYLSRKTLSAARTLKPDQNLSCDWRASPCLAQFLALATDRR